ncbi:MAG: DUF2079 domain-containing protein [Chloroflexi bacterium]|nr:DUF2079 domain-containing protein [Chloroflexota bacterium]
MIAMWLRFILVLALSLPFGVVGYFAPSSLLEWATSLRGKHPRAVRLGPAIGLAVAITVWAATFSTLSIWRHLALGTHAFDLGVYDQVIWNSSQGRLFEFSLSEEPLAANALNYLGFHFSPGLLALTPLYWIVPDVRALLVVQTLAIASTAIPIYLAAKQTLGRRMAALGLAVAFLLTPATGYINLFDFHSVALAMPFIALAVHFLGNRMYTGWGICMALAMSFKEDIAVVTLALGLYIALKQRRWTVGLGGVAGGLLWLYLAVEVIIPHFRGDSYYYLTQYSRFGGNLGQVALSLLLDPRNLLGLVADPARLEFALHLLVPLGLTPLVGLEGFLTTAPVFGYLFASGDPQKYSIIFHYSAPILGLLFAAAALGIRRLERFLTRSTRRESRRARPVLLSIMCFLLATSALSYFFNGRGLASIGYDASSYRPAPGASALFAALAQIPPEATVSAHRDLVPQLTHRRFVYLFPDVHDADFLVLWEGDDGADQSDQPEWKRQVSAALSDRRYEVLFRERGFVLMRRLARGQGST